MKEWLECWQWFFNSTRCFYNVIFLKLPQLWQEIETGTLLTGYKHLRCHQASSIHLGSRTALQLAQISKDGTSRQLQLPILFQFRQSMKDLEPTLCSQEQRPVLHTPHWGEHRCPVISVLVLFSKDCIGMLPQPRTIPVLAVFSLDSLPYTVPTYSRSLKHHHP